MRTLCVLALLFAATPAVAKPVEPPAGLIATVALGPDSALDGLRGFANAIAPGAGIMLTTQKVRDTVAPLVGATSLDGVDPAAWMYLAILDDGGTLHLALIGKAADEKLAIASAAPSFASIKDHWVVIGEKPIVTKLSAYAFGTVATAPTPAANGATVFVPALLAKYKQAITDARKQFVMGAGSAGNPAMTQMMESYFDGITSMLYDSDRIVITADVSADLAGVDIAMVPHAGSRLAKFVALQRPTDYALFDKLPASPAPMLMGGHLEMGPYHDGMFAILAQMIGPGAPSDIIGAMTAIMKASTGDVAVTASLASNKGMVMTQLFGLTDQPAAEKALGQALKAIEQPKTFEANKLRTTMQASSATATADGVMVRGYDITQDASKAPAQQQVVVEKMLPGGKMSAKVAMFDNLGTIAVGPDSLDQVKQTIATARGKGGHYVPPKAIGALLAASKARKDSFAFVIDIAGLMAAFVPTPPAGVQPFAMTIGCADKTAHLRFSVPATTVQALAKLKP